MSVEFGTVTLGVVRRVGVDRLAEDRLETLNRYSDSANVVGHLEEGSSYGVDVDETIKQPSNTRQRCDLTCDMLGSGSLGGRPCQHAL